MKKLFKRFSVSVSFAQLWWWRRWHDAFSHLGWRRLANESWKNYIAAFKNFCAL